MVDKNPLAGSVLITGGTSGLGLEMVRIFLEKGFNVVATGRRSLTLQEYERSFHLFCTDFSDLQKTADITNQICGIYNFDIVIDNAGILSPENFKSTIDGLEYTYQVNYLAHLLMNEIIIKKHDISKPLKIAAVTSPVYRIAQHDLRFACDKNSYRAIKAYSDSKLFLALMCRHLSLKYPHSNISLFSYIPGVFGSGIYRMRSSLFQLLYRIAAPFMRKPAKVAGVLADILINTNIVNGGVYNIKREKKELPEIDPAVLNNFWNDSYTKIEPFMK